jgi:hypothetical protein
MRVAFARIPEQSQTQKRCNMSKLLIALAFISLASVASAQEATTASPAWNDVVKTCSLEYRERADKTTKGREVWTTFLNECKARKGFVSKKNKTNPDFVRVPDKS